MIRSVFTFCSILAFGALSAALIAALAPWLSGSRLGSGPIPEGTLHFESLGLGLVLGAASGYAVRYNWADIPRRIVTWFLIRERQFFYYVLIGGCIAVLLFY